MLQESQNAEIGGEGIHDLASCHQTSLRPYDSIRFVAELIITRAVVVGCLRLCSFRFRYADEEMVDYSIDSFAYPFHTLLQEAILKRSRTRHIRSVRQSLSVSRQPGYIGYCMRANVAAARQRQTGWPDSRVLVPALTGLQQFFNARRRNRRPLWER